MPSEDTQFKNGNPGGPGRPKLTEKERAVREALRSEIAEVARLLTIPKEKALKEINKKDSTLLHQMLAKALKSKDPKIVESSFITRMLGAPKQVIEQTGKDGGPQIIVTIPSNGKEIKSDD